MDFSATKPNGRALSLNQPAPQADEEAESMDFRRRRKPKAGFLDEGATLSDVSARYDGRAREKIGRERG